MAQKYRSARAFIAGDAAHTHPPYGGFGLDNGLEDAVNLSWKLAAMLRGWGGSRVLGDSYSLERQPILRDVGEDIIGGWIRDDRETLQKYHPDEDPEEFARRFDELARGFGARLRDFEPHYEGSPVVLGPPGGTVSAHGSHTLTARAGHHLPPRRLWSGENVFERLGRDFTLLAFGAENAAVRSLTAAARSTNVPLTVVCDTGDGRDVGYGARLILVRPDQFVAWAADSPPDDVDALFMTVSGRS